MPASDVQERIAACFERLSPKQRRIARVIADDELFAAFATAAELGRAAGADAATVVRFARAIGFQGFSELQEAIRAQMPARLTFVQRLEQQLQQPLCSSELPARVFAQDIENLRQTLAGLSTEMLDAVARALVAAREVVVVGMGFSAATAVFLAYGLKSLGIRATAYTEGGPHLAIAVANLQTADVLVAISVWRYLRQTVDAVNQAAKRNAVTVALTDSLVAPVTRIARYSLVAATKGVTHSLSPVALLAVANVLLAQISLLQPDRTLAALREIDRLYQEWSLVQTESESRQDLR